MRIAESASHQIFERKWHRSYRYVCFSVEGITNLNAIDSSGGSRHAARGNTAAAGGSLKHLSLNTTGSVRIHGTLAQRSSLIIEISGRVSERKNPSFR
jgi:hypothetical protein